MTEFTEVSQIIQEIIAEIENKVESESEDNSTEILIDTSVRQLCCKQDIVASLSYEEENRVEGDEPVDVIAVLDGHGPNLVKDIITSADLYEHFSKDDPAESLQQLIDVEVIKKKKDTDAITYNSGTSYKRYLKSKISEKDIERSGATLSFVKIYRNLITKTVKIVPEWLGDSPIFIFVNGELVFQSEIHHASNEREVERMLKKGIITGINDNGGGFEVIDEDTIIPIKGKYIILKNKDQLAVTRSLGHKRITEVVTQKYFIERSTEDDIKIIVLTDGVGDVINIDIDLEKLLTFSSKEITELAEKRWKQTWNYGKTKTRFPNNGYDDCACAVWWQRKNNNNK